MFMCKLWIHYFDALVLRKLTSLSFSKSSCVFKILDCTGSRYDKPREVSCFPCIVEVLDIDSEQIGDAGLIGMLGTAPGSDQFHEETGTSRKAAVDYVNQPWAHNHCGSGITISDLPIESWYERLATSPHDPLDSIGYPRMSASGESSTTMHRLLHASGSHPIPPPDDPKSEYHQTTSCRSPAGINRSCRPAPAKADPYLNTSGLDHKPIAHPDLITSAVQIGALAPRVCTQDTLPPTQISYAKPDRAPVKPALRLCRSRSASVPAHLSAHIKSDTNSRTYQHIVSSNLVRTAAHARGTDTPNKLQLTLVEQIRPTSLYFQIISPAHSTLNQRQIWKEERYRHDEEDNERTVDRSKDKSKDKFKERSNDRKMKTSSNKRFSRKHDRKVLVAEESTKSWADSDSNSSSSSSSSSESEQEEVHCLMADQTDDDESSSIDSNSDEFEDIDILKTELSKLQAENEMLKDEASELKTEVDKLTVEMSSWNKANLSLYKLYESQKPLSDKTGIGFNNSEFCEGESSTQSRSAYDKFNKMSFVKADMMYNCLESVNTCVTLNGSGIQLAVGPQPLWLRNHNSGPAQRIMVKRLATLPHDPLVGAVAEEAIPIQQVAEPSAVEEPRCPSADDVDLIIQQVLVETREADAPADKAQSAVTEEKHWFDLPYDDLVVQWEAERPVVTASDTDEEIATIDVAPADGDQQVQVSVAPISNDDMLSADERMSLDDILLTIPVDIPLPSSSMEITQIMMGKSIKIPGVNKWTWFLKSLPSISADAKGKEILVEKDPVKGNPAEEHYSLICSDIDLLVDLRAKVIDEVDQILNSFSLKKLATINFEEMYKKEEQVLYWGETESPQVAIQRKFYILLKYRTVLVWKFLEAWRANFAPGQGSSAVDIQVIELLSDLYLCFLEELAKEARDLGLTWTKPCCSKIFEGSPRDRGAIIARNNTLTPSSLFNWIPSADISEFLSSVALDRTVLRSVQIAQSVVPSVQLSLDQHQSSSSTADRSSSLHFDKTDVDATASSLPPVSQDLSAALADLQANLSEQIFEYQTVGVIVRIQQMVCDQQLNGLSSSADRFIKSDQQVISSNAFFQSKHLDNDDEDSAGYQSYFRLKLKVFQIRSFAHKEKICTIVQLPGICQ
ncbi:hypothetical protein F511_11624 [Dorcoceras hygrometricum]|uniref:Uncharacterized protein n=1 Tax=Dorcoceras hygrometricum TaxID=472368 RepID=A0A2Z7DI40_9LAMI|nr:hypothetical protein F511_11624 [Dorcoceras hygrometricum]